VLAGGGFAVAVLAAVAARVVWRPGEGAGVPVPVGLAVAVAASASIVALGRLYGRVYGVVAAAGWGVGALLVLQNRPEGDYLVAGDWLGWGFLVGAPFAVIAVALWGTR